MLEPLFTLDDDYRHRLCVSVPSLLDRDVISGILGSANNS